MRRLYKVEELRALGYSRAAIRWGLEVGRWSGAARGVYADGPEPATDFDRARAVLMSTGGVASGTLAGAIHRLDDVEFTRPDITLEPSQGHARAGTRRRALAPDRIVEIGGVRCTDGLQTLIDLAAELDDDGWEAALESALRRRLVSLADLERATSAKTRGVATMRRVLALRPPGAPPTDSLLETRMVQLARSIPGLCAPERQVEVFSADGRFVARVDLAWPELGLFIELDGQQHKHQPVYDASRETAIVAATGWLCGRFTWREVVRVPNVTRRRLAALAERARARPVSLTTSTSQSGPASATATGCRGRR